MFILIFPLVKFWLKFDYLIKKKLYKLLMYPLNFFIIFFLYSRIYFILIYYKFFVFIILYHKILFYHILLIL